MRRKNACSFFPCESRTRVQRRKVLSNDNGDKPLISPSFFKTFYHDWKFSYTHNNTNVLNHRINILQSISKEMLRDSEKFDWILLLENEPFLNISFPKSDVSLSFLYLTSSRPALRKFGYVLNEYKYKSHSSGVTA